MPKKDLHSKLDRLRDHIVSKPTPQPPAEDLPERYRVLAERLDGTTVCNDLGGFCFIRKLFPAIYTHGEIALADFADRLDLPACAFTVADDPARLDLANLLFFDLETIGLGGSGTAAFLVGIGSLVENGFEVRQYLLPDYDDEAAMLSAVAEEFTDRAVLVSYNGAAFDLPILTARFTINRIGREIPHARHLDLLHTVRRLFKRRLRQCDLSNIERDVFNFRRFDDIPGFLVPSAYFDWLSDHRLDDMEKVLQHNRYDVISLYFLAAVIAEVFDSRGERLSQIDDLHSLARLFNRRRDLDTVTDLNRRVEHIANGNRPDRALDRTPSASSDPVGSNLPLDVLLFHAQTHKRRGEYEQAIDIWTSLAEMTTTDLESKLPSPSSAASPSFPRRREPRHVASPSPASSEDARSTPLPVTNDTLSSPDHKTLLRTAFRACIELAIHYEHRAKDFAAALDFTRRAERFPDLNPSRRRALQKRRERILKKQIRP